MIKDKWLERVDGVTSFLNHLEELGYNIPQTIISITSLEYGFLVFYKYIERLGD